MTERHLCRRNNKIIFLLLFLAFISTVSNSNSFTFLFKQYIRLLSLLSIHDVTIRCVRTPHHVSLHFVRPTFQICFYHVYISYEQNICVPRWFNIRYPLPSSFTSLTHNPESKSCCALASSNETISDVLSGFCATIKPR